MDRQLKKQCKQHIQYLQWIKTNGSGDKTYEPELDIKCKVDGYQTTYIGMDGEEYTSEYTIYMDETCPIMGMKDIIKVADGRSMPIRYFRPFKNERGIFEGAMLLI